MKIHPIFFILFILCNIALSEAGTLFGTVSDDQNSIAIKDVKLKLQPGNFDAQSDESGFFSFENIPGGTYKLIVSHPSYKKLTLNMIIIESGRDRELLIRLKRIKPFSGNRENNFYGESEKRTENSNESIVISEDVIFSESEHPPVMEMESMEVREPALPPATSGLRAGYADDNRQFNYFINFLKKYEQTPHYSLKISERICLNVLDRNGRSVPNAIVEIREKNRLLNRGKTFADGSFYIFPQDIDLKGDQIQVLVKKEDQSKSILLESFGLRDISIQLSEARNVSESIPLDLLFVLDATGSMSEEIARLKSTIEIINLNLSSLNIKLSLRFGLVAYRDREDDYVTRLIPFTANLDLFRLQLQQISADGGGDTPEDLQAALDDALHKMDWNTDGLRLAFIITDAGLHMDYGQKFTYADAAREAKQKAIKIFSVGTGGLDISGEYILRQISQYTSAKYIFLTYGEKGESEGGLPGSVSHHTGTNFNAEKLESVIIRFAKEELAHVSDITITQETSWFEGHRIEDETKQETLQKLFSQAIRELSDFSSMTINQATPVAALPFEVAFESQENNAEYFYEQFVLALSKNELFMMTERKDLQQITQEIGLKLSGLTENDRASKVGAFIGAEMLISGKFYFSDKKYELFLKLLRVETAEVLSVTRVRIDPKLGL